jgi:DNA repair protein RecO (recombination protein O)
MRFKSLAIPLRRIDYSASSQILTLLTREYGGVHCIAKGAYRPKSPFRGPFDLLTLVEVVLWRRPGSSSSLAIVSEATPVDGFRGIRRRWNRYAAGAHVLDFLRAVETPEDPTPELFDLAAWTLADVSRAERDGELTEILARFEWQTFRLLGLGAEIVACGDCGRPWRQVERPVFFCLDSAGVLCPRCRGVCPGRPGRVVPGRVVQRLNALGREPIGARDANPRPGAAEPADSRALRRLLEQLRVFLLERNFPMIEYTANFF